MSSGRSSRPAGSPSTTAVSPGPCDSPAVVKRSAISTPTLLAVERPKPPVGALPGLRDAEAGAVDEDGRKRCLGGRVCRGGDAGAGRGGCLAVLRVARRGRRGGLRAAAEALAPDVEKLQVVAH